MEDFTAFPRATHDGIQNFNYEDVRSNYDYQYCFTQDIDFNYVSKAPLNRMSHTKYIFESLRKYNQELWTDWPGSYMEMIEEVMCMSNRMHQLMKQLILGEDGETLLHPPPIFYAYKRARAVDARNNWQIYNERQSVNSDSTTDGYEPMEQGDEMNVHTPPPLNSPLSQPLPASVDDNSSTYSSADDALSQGMENGLSNVPSDLVNSSNVDDGLPVQDGTNCNHILLLPQEGTPFRETYDKLFNAATDAINTQKNASDLDGAYVSEGLVMQKYDTQMEQEYCKMLGNEDGKKLFTVNQAIHNNLMKNRWRDEMSKAVPHIVEDPEGLKSILTANPKLVVKTLHTLVEDWDGLLMENNGK